MGACCAVRLWVKTMDLYLVGEHSEGRWLRESRQLPHPTERTSTALRTPSGLRTPHRKCAADVQSFDDN